MKSYLPGMAKKTVLAIDLGAESGRVMAVHFDGQHLKVEPLHRFPNPITRIGDSLYWDALHLWREIQAGIEKGKRYQPASIGVDGWGIDFALLDRQGRLLGNPVNYRDPRTDGMMDAVFERVPKEKVFAQTGIQFISINTLLHLMSLVVEESAQLQAAATFLTIPDLINYWLTGQQVCEFTNATTTQLFNPSTGEWAYALMRDLGIPPEIFPEIIKPGTHLGTYDGIPVIAPACHDTGSAVAAVPATTSDFAYISSGTWSLVGLELPTPIISPKALAVNASNEGGVASTYRFLKNVMGLWIVQQCRSTWAREGVDFDYGQLTELAATAPPFQALIYPDDKRFLMPGDHPEIIREMCAQSSAFKSLDEGAIVRTVLESLALRYKEVIDILSTCANQEVHTIHIVGGGSRNVLLNQMTADATGIPVVSGPSEATVLGNALVQFLALGEFASLEEARRLLSQDVDLRRHEPTATSDWKQPYAHYLQIKGNDY